MQASSSSSAGSWPCAGLATFKFERLLDPFAAAASGPVQASAASSGPEQAFAADVSGLEQALRAVAEISARAGVRLLMASIWRALCSGDAAGVSEALLGGERSETTLHNPWNLVST